MMRVPHRRRQSRWRILGYGVLGLVLLTLVALPFGLSDWLLRQAIARAEAKLATRGLSFHADRATQDGLTSVAFSGVLLGVPGREPLLWAKSMQVELSPWHLLVGDLQVTELVLDSALVRIHACSDSTSNLPPSRQSDADGDSTRTLSTRINNLWSRLTGYWPQEMHLRDVSLILRTEHGSYQGLVQQATWADSITVDALWAQQRLMVRGQRNPFSLVVQTPDTNRLLALPLLDRLRLGADSLTLSIPVWDVSDEQFRANIRVQALHPALDQPKLSRVPVLLDSLFADLQLSVTGNRFQLDSTSQLHVNGLPLSPFVVLQTRPDTLAQLSLSLPWTTAQTVFDALPPALFEGIGGMLVEGDLSYRLDLGYNSTMPDSLRLYAALDARDFRIQRYGQADLGKLARGFTHRTFREGRLLYISDSNPNFTPLSQISPFLKEAVLTNEDGSFYWHKGFNEGSLKKAVLDNLRRRRFARGASTISMQLVKNVFLTPEKTLGRKLEEALLVWLIEHNRLATKDRMLEVYFNIIEWGPGIYGVTEASQYYFNKHPSQIYPEEAMFLAMIVPRPRSFAYAFDENGQLRESYHHFFKLVGGLMVKRGILSPEQDSMLVPPRLELAGRARAAIRARFGVKDSTGTGLDTLPFPSPLLGIPDDNQK